MPEIPDQVRNDKFRKVENIPRGNFADEKTGGDSVSQNLQLATCHLQPVRVKINFPATRAQISAPKKFQLFGDEKKLGEFKKIDLQISGREVQFRGPEDFLMQKFKVVRAVASADEILEIENFENRPSWNLNLNDNKFFGILEMRIVDGKLIFINELPLEKYLLGVAESPESDHFEKQKAMAILARSYAAFYLKPENRKFPDAPFDLDDSPNHCQKFLGANFAARAPNWIRAVNSTENLVVKFRGELVKTPYFNSSDGMTRSAKTVWGWENAPYLSAVRDPAGTGGKLNGHGVGLSGTGAQKMATDGKKFEEIIYYFYRGVEIGKLNSAE